MKYNPLYFSGRLRRWHYIPLMAIFNIIDRVADQVEPDAFGPVTVLSLLTLWPTVTLSIQRAHDSGRDGWYFAKATGLSMVGAGIVALTLTGDHPSGLAIAFGVVGVGLAIVGIIMSLIITFSEGTVGANQYGPDPRAAIEGIDTGAL